MTARELRQKYLAFFETKGHQRYPSGSLVPYDVTGKLDESLLFNGAGMVQFKPFFRGAATPPHPRLTNSQKCVRTGDIESVGDLTHLTFFEMLGNFSFGDYFKKDAIAYSWEFMTSKEWLGLDPARLSFTVFEDDDEAFALWSEHVRAAGFEPEHRIFRLGEETNYWPAGAFSNGPPGPCGPNSEMFYWTAKEPPPSGPYTREDYLRDEAAGKWLEIWNDVFIQFEWKGTLRDPERPASGYEKAGLDPLPFQSVDTGMGLERTATVLGGFQSVYDTDLFQPVFAALERATGYAYGADEGRDRAARIIADHIRTAVFCIADGILPGNTGRGYVLRRLIRRAVLKGQRALGAEKPFFHLVYEGVVEALGDHYHELGDLRDVIVETLQNEEAQFRRTLVAGYDSLLKELASIARDLIFRTGISAFLNLDSSGEGEIDEMLLHKETRWLNQITNHQEFLQVISGCWDEIEHAQSELPKLEGERAFKLYDTYGFPLEVTVELAAEAGIEVDVEGYEMALKEAQERSRGASEMDTVYGSHSGTLVLSVASDALPVSRFVGYRFTDHTTRLVQISPIFDEENRATGRFQVSLAETPFYAESGGQVGDTGRIDGPGFAFHVDNTWKAGGLIWNDAELADFEGPSVVGMDPPTIRQLLDTGVFFKDVRATVDLARRRNICRNHTATHLLHAALRAALGKHVTQAGSLVAPDHLRFDFTHGKAMAPDEVARVEEMVNAAILAATPVAVHEDLPLDEARKAGAMALFGEKYGDRVRMVQVGQFSLELCGGCHVNQTSEIGLFKILNESSAASGVRRIEALTGEGSVEWVRGQVETLREAAALLRTTPGELPTAIEKTLETLREERKRLERMRTQAVDSGADADISAVGELELAVQGLRDGDMKEATLIADRLAEGKPARVVLVGLAAEGKLTFVCKVGPDAQAKGAHAGNLVREIAKLAGGGGGGRPDFATAGGKDPAMFDAALAAAKGLLEAQL
ncbi:MAG: alanine--tRNA ligase [Fimbriimonadaceae bacterium]|nr:alanine--tRNA ligase [Fimbriimonadaceae bacterium]